MISCGERNSLQGLPEYDFIRIAFFIHYQLHILLHAGRCFVSERQNGIHLSQLRRILHIDIRNKNRIHTLQLDSADNSGEASRRRNIVFSPFHYVEILPVEIASGIGDTYRQQLLFSGFCFIGNIHMERCFTNQVIGHKLTVKINFCAHPDRFKVNYKAFLLLICRNRNFTIPPAHSPKVLRTRIISNSEIFFHRTRYLDRNCIGIMTQGLPTTCGDIYRQQ